MDPFKKQIDDRTSYKSLDEQFYEARLDKDGIDKSDWPSQIDRAAIDVSYGVALGKTGSQFDYGGTIGRNDFGSACGPHYVTGLRALASSQSDLPRLIQAYDASDLGDLAFRLNELRVELEKLDLGDSDISDLNRTIEALVEKLITQGSSGDLARQPLQKPEAVADLLYQLFSDPAVTTYADVLIDSITGETGTSIGNRSLLEHLDRPQMVTPLWDHQQEAIKEWVTADTKGYVNMATATGKTVLGLAAIAHKFGELHPADTETIPSISTSSDTKKRVLIVAGQDLLLQQWQSEFDEHLNIPRSRTFQNQTTEANVVELTWGTIEFRTAQELLNTDLQHRYDLVILDEAHRYKSGRQDSRGWRDLFEDLVDSTDSILAMSGSIDDEWLGDDAVKNALDAHLEPCIEFTIADARAQNVIADFRWDVCYAASDTGETVDSIATSTKPLASVYNSTHHKFEPHELSDTIPEAVPDQFETLRDLRSFAHTKEGKQARDNNDAFDRFATAAFSRKPKRWQLSPPAETISQLLKDHLPERKCIVLVQSYAQAETIGDHLKELYDDELVTVPEQATEAPYDSITEFKNASQGVLVGPGKVLGVGVDLPNADVAINLAKGGVNASLIQRIGRILRNPTGEKEAHFYQVVTITNSPDARLPGEDGRRLLRRASEFRALGSRFRELPGFVVADNTASEIVRVLETHGSQAKIKDERPTKEMVEDDVARRFLDELTTEIDSKVGESLSHPVLTTYWKPESLSPGTLPVRESVEQLDEDEDTGSEPNSGSPSTDELESEAVDQLATLTVDVRDDTGTAIRDASVVIENPSPIATATTGTNGEAICDLPASSDDVCVFVSNENYQNHFTSTAINERNQRLSVTLTAKPEPKDEEDDEDTQHVQNDLSEMGLSELLTSSESVKLVVSDLNVILNLLDCDENTIHSELHLLLASGLFEQVSDNFPINSLCEQLTTSDQIEVRQLSPSEKNLPRVLLTEEQLLYPVEFGTVQTYVKASHGNLHESISNEFDSQFNQANDINLYVPSWTELLNELAEATSQQTADDLELLVDTATLDELVSIDAVSLILITAARTGALQYTISRWAEDMNIVSAATFSRRKGELVNEGIVRTESVPVEVGRPREQLLLTDKDTQRSGTRSSMSENGDRNPDSLEDVVGQEVMQALLGR